MNAYRLDNIERGTPVTITVNGHPMEAYPGESIAAALLAAGRRAFRQTLGGNAPRGLFCGMGICYDCLVTVDGVPNVRSCMTAVQEGCVIELSSANGPRDEVAK